MWFKWIVFKHFSKYREISRQSFSRTKKLKEIYNTRRLQFVLLVKYSSFEYIDFISWVLREPSSNYVFLFF